MPALCLMLSGTYYAKNYAGIIGRGLYPIPKTRQRIDIKGASYLILRSHAVSSTTVLCCNSTSSKDLQ